MKKQDVVVDPDAQQENNVEGSQCQPNDGGQESQENEEKQAFQDFQKTKEGQDSRLRVQRKKITPMTGQVIEVLWAINAAQKSDEDTNWKPGKCLTGAKSRYVGGLKYWWPATITSVNADGKVGIRYSKNLTGCDPSDLEDTIHEVSFFGEMKLRHLSGTYHRMVARWRFCLWDSEYISDSDSFGSAEENEQDDSDQSHVECRSALVQVSSRLQQLESKFLSLQSAVGAIADLSSTNRTSLKKEILLERLNSVLRAYVFAGLFVETVPNVAKRRKMLNQYAVSEQGAVSSGVKRLGEVDCMLSEFLLLSQTASRVVEEGVKVQPCAFKTSFLNLRSRDTIRLVFQSFGGFCKALNMPAGCIDGLMVGANRELSASTTYNLRCVGFNICRRVGELSESMFVLGAGSSMLESTSKKNVRVIYRPLSKWNLREQRFGSNYKLEYVSIQRLRNFYFQEHCKSTMVSDRRAMSDHECVQEGEQRRDFTDFEICVEWKQKHVVMHNAYSASNFADDILGSAVLSVPCVEFRTKSLCQSVENLLSELSGMQTK